MIFCVPLASMLWRSRILSVVTVLATSAALKVPEICVSRSVRSTNTMTVGASSSGVLRSFCAANTMSSDFPDPWKCQISPFLMDPSLTRSTIRLAPSYCWKRGMILMRLPLLLLNKVKFLRMSRSLAGCKRSCSLLPTSANPNACATASSLSTRQGAQCMIGVPTAP